MGILSFPGYKEKWGADDQTDTCNYHKDNSKDCNFKEKNDPSKTSYHQPNKKGDDSYKIEVKFRDKLFLSHQILQECVEFLWIDIWVSQQIVCILAGVFL